jgi:diguanylate cyclase (GGDEF)-like protein
MESNGWLIKDTQGNPLRVIVVSHDITERKQNEAKFRDLAFHDALTQLPNRRLLDDRLEQAIAASKRNGHFGAVMFLDLDNFKPINDTHGHKAGDLLLIEVARRLSGCVREVDTVARFGGDEFVVVISKLDGEEQECIEQSRSLAEKIRASLAGTYWLSSDSAGTTKMIIHHDIQVSIGIALFKNNSAAEKVLKHADKAMYKAKEAGRNTIYFHESSK